MKRQMLLLLLTPLMFAIISAGCSGKNGAQGQQGQTESTPPVIQSLSAQGLPSAPGGYITATVIASGTQGIALTYKWTTSNGWYVSSGGNSPTAIIYAPNTYSASGTLGVEVSDIYGSAVSTIPVSTIPSSPISNSSPVISSISASPNPIVPGGTITVTVVATDPDGDTLNYAWSVPNGWSIAYGQGTTQITVTAPNQHAVSGTISVIVSDGRGGNVNGTINISTTNNSDPVISSITASPNPVGQGDYITVTIAANDSDGDTLSYSWSTSNGWNVSGGWLSSTATIHAPYTYGVSGTVTVQVSDAYGGYTSTSITVSTLPAASPIINALSVSPNPMNPPTDGSNTLAVATVDAIDPNGNSLTFTWSITSTTAGWSITGSGYTATVICPFVSNSTATITVEVSNNGGGIAYSTTTVNSGIMQRTYPISATYGGEPYGIAIDSSGNIWVAESVGYVLKLNSNGTIIGNYVGGGPGGYPDIAIDHAGNVWVTDYSSGNIIAVNSGQSGITDGNTMGIAIDNSGNRWAVNYNDSTFYTIVRLDSSGAVVQAYTTPTYLGAIVIDSSNNVWVAQDGFNGKIFNITQGYSCTVGTYPVSMAIDQSGYLWVVNSGSNNITRWGNGCSTLATYAVGSNPQGIAIDNNYRAWVANYGSNTITELNNAGVQATYSVGVNPQDVAVDSSGNVWVVNYGSNSITEILGVATGPQYFPYSGPQWP